MPTPGIQRLYSTTEEGRSAPLHSAARSPGAIFGAPLNLLLLRLPLSFGLTPGDRIVGYARLIGLSVSKKQTENSNLFNQYEVLLLCIGGVGFVSGSGIRFRVETILECEGSYILGRWRWAIDDTLKVRDIALTVMVEGAMILSVVYYAANSSPLPCMTSNSILCVLCTQWYTLIKGTRWI